MGNGTKPDKEVLGHLFELWAKVSKLIVEGKRDPQKIIDFLQAVIMEKPEKFKLVTDLGIVMHPDARRFRVEVWGHARLNQVSTSSERLCFLETRDATLLGQLGLDLVNEQGLREQLPRRFCHSSFEAGNLSRVPYLFMFSDDDWGCRLRDFELDLDDDYRLFCFVEVK